MMTMQMMMLFLMIVMQCSDEYKYDGDKQSPLPLLLPHSPQVFGRWLETHDDDDDIYIMMQCLSVCNEK